MPKKLSRGSRPNKPGKQPLPRLPSRSPWSVSRPIEQAIVEAINSGPRGRFSNEGPVRGFPACAGLRACRAQQLGGHLRFKTGVPPRLSGVRDPFLHRPNTGELSTVLEWYVHARIALIEQGVKEATIRALHAGRVPKSGTEDGVVGDL